MTSPRHSVSVAGIVVNDAGHVLVIRRRDSGEWQPPGGVLELAEAIEDGLRREVFEETGVIAEPERLTGVYKNLPLGVVALVFRCRPISGAPQPTDEATEVRWLPADEATAAMRPAFAIRVADAIAPPAGSPPVRLHDGVELISTPNPA